MELNFINAVSLNRSAENDVRNLIRLSEDNYSCSIRLAAEQILSCAEDHPLVLLSGPSGSGKTTAALRIAERLRASGRSVITISMDDYFLPCTSDNLPIGENGEVDLESPYRVDIPLFKEHLTAMRDCLPVAMPQFSFITQERSSYVNIRRQTGEIVIIEGIHALNPLVTGDSRSFTTRIYASVRTRIRFGESGLMHPRLIRLMRRLCRDRLFRGRGIKEVFDMLPSVSKGEDLYITPYKQLSDIEIDTFMPYEACVYRSMIYEDLLAADEEMRKNEIYNELVGFMSQIHPVSPSLIPADSMLCEFTGSND